MGPIQTYVSPSMKAFLTPQRNARGTEIEEVLDQPLYHIQSYGTAGNTQFTFFNVTTGGYSVTNMDAQSVLSKGKRFGIFSLGVAFLPGQNPVQDTATTTLNSALNDAKNVLEGAGWLELNILEKNYLRESPLTRVPAGIGLWNGGAAFQRTQAAAADGTRQASYATNGIPVYGVNRRLRVAIPLPEQTKFAAVINYPTAVTVQTAGSIGVWLEGLQVRATQ